MRKVSPLLLVFVLSMGLFGCGSQQAAQNSIEDALALFDNGDREGTVEILHEIDSRDGESIYVSDPVTITQVYAYDVASDPSYVSVNGKHTYNLYIFGEAAAPGGEISKMQIGSPKIR